MNIIVNMSLNINKHRSYIPKPTQKLLLPAAITMSHLWRGSRIDENAAQNLLMGGSAWH